MLKGPARWTASPAASTVSASAHVALPIQNEHLALRLCVPLIQLPVLLAQLLAMN